MKKLDKEKLEIEKIIREKLERDKLELEIYKRTQREEGDRTFEVDSFIETNNKFWKGAEILIENEEQKNDKSKIQELTLEIESLKEKMEQILKSTQNETLKTPNAQNIVNLEAESQVKVKSTIPENKRNEAQVELYDNQSRENNNLSDENIQDNELQAMRASLFPFGMVQTPFQIMLNWPVKFGNNTDDSPTIFLNNLLRFKRGYKINEQDTLENLDAVLIGEAQSWYQVNKRNWHNLENFIQEFKQV